MMSDKNKSDTSPLSKSSKTIKNPLLSTSVTGLTFDDFTQNAMLLPAAPMLEVYKEPETTDIKKPIIFSAQKPGAAPQLEDTADFSEINLDASSDTLSYSLAPPVLEIDAKNSLLEPKQDTYLNQATASFAQLPAVASTVFSTFSNIIKGTSPGPDDKNAQVTLPAESLKTEKPKSTLDELYDYQNYHPQSINSASLNPQHPPPPAPTFFSPTDPIVFGHVPSLPPPSNIGGNTYRLGGAKKKTYAHIPGLSINTAPIPSVALPELHPQGIPPSVSTPHQEIQAPPNLPQKSSKFSLLEYIPTNILEKIPVPSFSQEKKEQPPAIETQSAIFCPPIQQIQPPAVFVPTNLPPSTSTVQEVSYPPSAALFTPNVSSHQVAPTQTPDAATYLPPPPTFFDPNQVPSIGASVNAGKNPYSSSRLKRGPVVLKNPLIPSTNTGPVYLPNQQPPIGKTTAVIFDPFAAPPQPIEIQQPKEVAPPLAASLFQAPPPPSNKTFIVPSAQTTVAKNNQHSTPFDPFRIQSTVGQTPIVPPSTLNLFEQPQSHQTIFPPSRPESTQSPCSIFNPLGSSTTINQGIPLSKPLSAHSEDLNKFNLFDKIEVNQAANIEVAPSNFVDQQIQLSAAVLPAPPPTSSNFSRSQVTSGTSEAFNPFARKAASTSVAVFPVVNKSIDNFQVAQNTVQPQAATFFNNQPATQGSNFNLLDKSVPLVPQPTGQLNTVTAASEKQIDPKNNNLFRPIEPFATTVDVNKNIDLFTNPTDFFNNSLPVQVKEQGNSSQSFPYQNFFGQAQLKEEPAITTKLEELSLSEEISFNEGSITYSEPDSRIDEGEPIFNSNNLFDFKKSVFEDDTCSKEVLLDTNSMAAPMDITADSTSLETINIAYRPIYKHWFYKRTVETKIIWTPFSMTDSLALEDALPNVTVGEEIPTIVHTDGGRYDVTLSERLRAPVYWNEASSEVRRCSWFYKGVDSRFVPYEEDVADLLETQYKDAATSGDWHRRIVIPNGETVVFHGPSVIVHFLKTQNPDSWGNTSPVVPQTTNRPRVVKRGVDEFNIEDGEPERIDHLLFMVHGIGEACDLKFRPVEEVVDEFRSISMQLVQSHYRSSFDRGEVGRVEILPISWHNDLHSEESGIDQKLKAITLESIPKLRNFTNDTLLDILFYTSPMFCQNIIDAVGNSLNRLYASFCHRNPSFQGGVSLAGHSLGSLILFDLLCHQKYFKPETENSENPDGDAVSPLPVSHLHNRPLTRKCSQQINYEVGPAGTGQPYITYPQLAFNPKKFFALGSPIGMFVTIRGIDTLGLNFKLPTCDGFYNIFHPYDPVAYRCEALVNPDLSTQRPVLIPHHKGRKRMHLELKETMVRVGTDIKQKVMDTFRNTLDAVYSITSIGRPDPKAIEKEVDKVIEDQLKFETGSTSNLSSSDLENEETDTPLGQLNQKKRIDYVLQEAPLEFFNEYLFALTSHVCYWESEDTMLFLMKEIYSNFGIQSDSQIPQQTMTIERPISNASACSHNLLSTQDQSPSMDTSSRPSSSTKRRLI